MPEEEVTGREGRAQELARLEGVRLAARTLEHHLTNHLTLTVGYAELIAEETRMGMLIGVAVGWELARELGKMPDADEDEPETSGGT